MTMARHRRAAVLVLTLVLLALFVVRPGVNGLRKRIISSVSLALGRKVEVQWVKLRLLPQPGFDLINFVVHDDPAFSAEPLLRAEEVTAALRLRSLLHGRMEIGRLSLKEPSFNLVRGDNGHWNLESMIARAAHTEAAPTRNTLPERRPVFPYIEGEDGRINFKIGMEKKSYSLSDADFALWLESENQWGMRMSAEPVRTDFNLTDTGTLRVNGSWQRSDSLPNTPLKFTFRWDGAQMGEITKLLYGRDMGWRGGLSLAADLSGTPADLSVRVKSSVNDFRRYDIVTQQSLRLATSCNAHYSSIERAINRLVCRSPVGDGLLSVKGSIGAPTGPRAYDLVFAIEDVPLQSLVNLALRTKENLPEDLNATGTVTGSFSVRNSPTPQARVQWSGSGQTDHFVLHSADSKTELTLGTVPFSVQTVPTNESTDSPVADSHSRLEVGPFTLALAKQASASVHGWATDSGYNFTVQGDGPVPHLLQAAQIAGLPVPKTSAEGHAKFNLLLVGKWSNPLSPQPTGTAQLRAVRGQLPGLSGVVDIRSANLVLDDDMVHVRGIVAVAAGTTWEGSLSFPRPCHLLSGCPIHFGLHTDAVAADRLHSWLSPARGKRPWYRFAESASKTPWLLAVLNANGTLAANRVDLHGVTASRVSCNVNFEDGTVHLTALTANVLGGKHRGDWTGNLHVSPPEFEGSGKFEQVALPELAKVMHDDWISGMARGAYQFSAVGGTLQDWLASATGSLQFEMRNGSLPHILIPAATGPLQVQHFSGLLTLGNGTFEITEGRLEDGGGIYDVSGSALPGQILHMRLARPGGSFLIEGTLSAPHVVPVSATATRASLKP